MNKIFLVILCFVFTVTYSQNKQKQFVISGVLIASDKTPLESATVYLQRVKDSSLVTYTITNQKGEFTLENKAFESKLNLFISYIGYETYAKEIAIATSPINLGIINLKESENLLDEVVVLGAPPITVKNDTLEFNVTSFKTKKDASVEDLLKKLPGVEVDADGKITVNGRDVSNIYVNGKPFFGDDPTITTRNLTKDIIDKIQITDTKTKSEAFTGEESQSDNKTINLTIKEDSNKGVFGRVSGGVGTDDRYETAGMLNIFDNDQRISILAAGNNINSLGFSFGEIQKMFGGESASNIVGGSSFRRGGASSRSGIITSKNTGFNYVDDLSKEVELSANYFYSNSDSENKNAIQRENILPNTRYFTNSNSNSTNETHNHNANLEIGIKWNPELLINFKPSFSASKNTRINEREEESRNNDNVVTNESNTNSFVESIRNNFSNELDITRKFGENGAFIKIVIDNEINRVLTDNFLNSQTEVFGNNPESIIRDQFTDGKEETNRLSTGLTIRVPIKVKELSVDFRYRYRTEKQNNIRSTYDFNTNTQEFNDFNTNLSTDFEYNNTRNVPGLRLNYRKGKMSFNLSGDYVFRQLENKDDLRPSLNLKRNFKAIEVRTRLNYKLSPISKMSFRYSLNNITPNIRELQPFENVSNPLNTITGNPNLEPTNSHNININYNNFNFQKGVNFYSYFNGNINENQVVSKTVIDEDFIRNTTYVNVDGSYNSRMGLGGMIIKRLDTVRTLNFGGNISANFNKSIQFNNEIKYAATNTSFAPSLFMTFNWKGIMEISPRYLISFVKNKFDIDQFNSQSFKYHNLRINTATFFPKKLEWRNSINYNYNPNIADGFQKSAWFWNSTLSYSIMKDNGSVSLKAYDLLNQNTNASRIATGNYIQDSQSTVLQRYFMLSFSWKFNSLGKAGEINDHRGLRSI